MCAQGIHRQAAALGLEGEVVVRVEHEGGAAGGINVTTVLGEGMGGGGGGVIIWE